MTLQLALIGQDGIILASDRQLNRTLNNVSYGSLTSKIRLNHPRGMAACWSGYDVADELAKQVLNLDDEKLKIPNLAMEELAQNVFGEARRTTDAPHGEIILVMTRDLNKVHLVTVRGNSYICHQITNWAVSGHDANSALFFIQAFYQKLPIKELIPLAAHTIFRAGQLNPAGVSGLEIFRCTEEGFDLLKEEEIANLKEWSKKLDSKIKRLLFRFS
ncbi:MAG TPA: hypothetical protein VEG64_13775 [Candidatus Sulfotelmatobacter sp.]|nr:hypothetical protein [Candidatus Sulfotelmatobacter sp.]